MRWDVHGACCVCWDVHGACCVRWDDNAGGRVIGGWDVHGWFKGSAKTLFISLMYLLIYGWFKG